MQISKVVLTVPPYFAPEQTNALKDAAKHSGKLVVVSSYFFLNWAYTTVRSSMLLLYCGFYACNVVLAVCC